MFPELCDGSDNPHYKWGAPPYMRTEQFDFIVPLKMPITRQKSKIYYN
jgi:hypothetical protein